MIEAILYSVLVIGAIFIIAPPIAYVWGKWADYWYEKERRR